jgi:hypothetical protein
MTWQIVGVMSPGEMGAAVATVLRTHGLRVVTCLEGRSARTRQRAEAAQLEVVPTLERLVTTVEAVLSIVPTFEAPAVGAGIAQAVRQSEASITFIEAAAQLKPAMAPGAAQIITALAQLPWEPQESPDQAALARQLPVQELIALLASKGLRQATGEPAR